MRARILTALLLTACGSASAPPVQSADDSAGVSEAPPAPPGDDGVDVEAGLLPPMPVAVTSFGAAVSGDHLYVLGGYHGTPHQYSREGQSRSLWRVPLVGGEWEQAGHIEHGLQGLALVAHDGVVCRFGGNRILNPAGEPANMRSVDDAACVSPATNEWTALPALPAGRSSHEAAVIGEVAYVAGGWQLGEGGPTDAAWAEDVLALDLHGGDREWRRIEAPFRRRAVGVASAAGKLVVLGGLTPEREVSRQVDVLDPATGEWSRGPDFPSDAFGAAAVGVGDRVYASARDGVVYAWQVGSEAWAPAASLAFPRFFHQLRPAADGELIAVGGISGMHTAGRTRHVERVALDATAPQLLTWTADYPGAAKNRQAAFVNDDYLYLFGGNNSLGQHDFEPENFVSDGWRLHLPSMTWESIAPYPANRQTMQTVTLGGQGVAVGGFGHDGEAAVTHPQAFAFDFASGEWSERGGLPRGRTQFGLVSHGERLWIFGGLNYDPSREGQAAFDHVTGSLATPEGEPGGAFADASVELPGPRRAFAGAALEGRYYIVGGMQEGFQLVDDCLVHDFGSGDFAPIACPRRTRLSGHLIPLEGKLYLLGGSYRGDDGMETDRSVEVYDPATNTWEVLVEELPFDTRHMHALAYRDRILMFSTHTEDPRSRVALLAP